MKLTQNQWIVVYVLIAVVAYWWFFARAGKKMWFKTEAPAPTEGEAEDMEAASEDLGYTREELSASRYHAGARRGQPLPLGILGSMDNPMGLAGTYNTSDEHQGAGGYVM